MEYVATAARYKGWGSTRRKHATPPEVKSFQVIRGGNSHAAAAFRRRPGDGVDGASAAVKRVLPAPPGRDPRSGNLRVGPSLGIPQGLGPSPPLPRVRPVTAVTLRALRGPFF
jgi:hypothetical protein